jgi:hypothetical protein
MEVTLSDKELEFLLNMLDERHLALLNEIAHTEHREFKQGLLKDEKTLDSLVDHLRGGTVAGSRE